MGRTRATLRGKWWSTYFASIRHCYLCGGRLARKYVKAEQTRRHVCVKCGQITYLNPKIVAGIIPRMPDGRLVLLRRNIEPALGRWSYPAGFQELAETVHEAAAREAWEEISVKVEVGKLVGIYSYADAGVVTIIFDGRVIEGQRPRMGLEAKEVGLFEWEEIPWKDLAFRSTTEALKDWKRQQKGRRRR